MGANLRHEVFKVYRMLHRTKEFVFKGDPPALLAARNKINEEFKKNKEETDEEKIEKMLKLSRDVESLLRKSVVQAKEKTPGVYELQMRPEVELSDNVPYTGPTIGIEELSKGEPGKCRQEQAAEKSTA